MEAFRRLEMSKGTVGEGAVTVLKRLGTEGSTLEVGCLLWIIERAYIYKRRNRWIGRLSTGEAGVVKMVPLGMEGWEGVSICTPQKHE